MMLQVTIPGLVTVAFGFAWLPTTLAKNLRECSCAQETVQIVNLSLPLVTPICTFCLNINLDVLKSGWSPVPSRCLIHLNGKIGL